MYITFGDLHLHKVAGNTFNNLCVACIRCVDKKEGVEIRTKIFGDGFFASYMENEFNFDAVLYFFPRGIIEIT